MTDSSTVSVPEHRSPIRCFVIYAHEDRSHLVALEKHLTPLRDERLIASFTDLQIDPGGRWRETIGVELERADVFLLLVSADFQASKFIKSVELKRAMERARASHGRVHVIPIIIDHCDWSSGELAELNVLPKGDKTVIDLKPQSKAWASIALALRTLIEEGRAGGGAPSPVSTVDTTPYLKWLLEDNRWLDVRGMGAKEAVRMELERVYTRLHVATLAPDREPRDQSARSQRSPLRHQADDEAREGRQTHELRDVFASHWHAALIGDPGSGKTTFLRYVAQRLARAHLGDAGALADIGLSGPPPFPVLVRLSGLARYLTEHASTSLPTDSPGWFYRYLDYYLAEHPVRLPKGYVRQRVQGGRCCLLLDGLDEVPSAEMRERITEIVRGVVVHGNQVGNRHLITCRTRAWRGRAQLAGGVVTLHLAAFEREQVEEFVRSWALALFGVAADAEATDPARSDAERHRKALLTAIAENPSGESFTASPLMLTVLAVVYWNRNQLPEQRAELYAAAVDYLLESRRGHTSLETPSRRECLQAVAIRMFRDNEGVQRTIGRSEAAAAVQQLLGGSLDSATAFLEQEELHSGLLVSREDGEVEFWHLTFQEYLAALEMSPLDDDNWAVLAPHLHDDRWAELVLLLAGCERRVGVREARRMINRILATGTDLVSKAKAAGLIGRILRDIKPYGLDASQGTNYQELLLELLPIFTPGGEVVDERTRIEVGEALGQAGDPRLVDRTANRVFIPGGTFRMGAQAREASQPSFDPMAFPGEAPVHRATVSDLYIGRYPVTVAEFAEFVDAEAGYRSADCWTADGWRWRAHREHPGDWDGQRKHPNRPVTRVSWYESDAYASWIGGRLPTEAEWEWVARGSSGRRYPWGEDAPTPDRASFDGRFRAPAPVGIYPKDLHEHGVRDLAGNVCEWCADWFGPYGTEPTTDPIGPAHGPSRVLRGGSFGYSALFLRAACRFLIHPGGGYDDVGFRVVWSSAGGQTQSWALAPALGAGLPFPSR